ncbi:MAG: M20/M25/M40 family metallo-hydrolase [Planctomycetes bacterium]|nr:M20/M25/M40 family metallo-hydrolase [Planctomycetota bacterium]
MPQSRHPRPRAPLVLGPFTALLLAFVAISSPVRAQEDEEPQVHAEVTIDGALRDEIRGYRGAVRDIVKHALKDGQAYESLADLCRRAPKRLSGSPGSAAAVALAQAMMKSAGFENVRLEPVMVPHWEPGDLARVRVLTPARGITTPLPIVPLGGSVATPADGIEAEVVEVPSIEALRALEPATVRGKIVYFDRPMDPTMITTFQAYGGAVKQRTLGAVEAGKLGAVAVLIRSVTTLKDDEPHTGAMRYDDGVPRIPAAALSYLAADRLSALIARGEPVRLALELDCKWFEDEQSYNVVGEIVGREKADEVLVVGGHLDSWSIGDGAHDDGAGCMQSVEALRILLRLGLKPRRTIRCVLFMNEENGLRGGTAYHLAHREEMAKHVLALEADAGGFTPRGFSTDARPEGKRILEEIARLLVNVDADKVWGGGGGADISPMAADGVPLVGYRPDSHRYFDVHHSRHDVFASVNERELELGAACMASLLYIVADLEATLPRNGR